MYISQIPPDNVLTDCKAQRPTPSNGITQPNMKVCTIKASLDHKEKEKKCENVSYFIYKFLTK